MNTLYWIIQVVLAVMFGLAGAVKATQPIEKLAPNMPWVNDYSSQMVRYIGIAEILGAVGLILPYATGILPWLTGLAGLGLAAIMVMAGLYHYRRGERQAVIINAVLFILSLEVALYRML